MQTLNGAKNMGDIGNIPYSWVLEMGYRQQ